MQHIMEHYMAFRKCVLTTEHLTWIPFQLTLVLGSSVEGIHNAINL
jgi:hypothetical protein